MSRRKDVTQPYHAMGNVEQSSGAAEGLQCRGPRGLTYRAAASAMCPARCRASISPRQTMSRSDPLG